MKTFELPNKIVWRGFELESPEKAFYPSFYKEFSKKEAFFEENFRFEFANADKDNLNSLFFPLYKEEIMSREDYTMDRNKILLDLEKKISADQNHKFLFIYHKQELIYALLFTLKKGGLFFGYRAFKRHTEKSNLRGATVSYWAEKLVFDFGKNNGITFFSRGKDSHPFEGRKRIGLPLFKLKTGMKPKEPEAGTPFETTLLSEDDIKNKQKPYLFFSDKNASGMFTVCNLYYPSESLDKSLINEFRKVVAWSGLEFNEVAY
ncbi:MAG: hypothetical protein ACOYS2_01045 [Patescibacteria group bacterium]